MSSKKLKFDMTVRMNGLMEKSETITTDRFAQAAQIVAHKPSGLTHRTPATEITGTSHSVSPAPGNDVIWALIKHVRDNPRNARKLYDPVKISQRAASIRQDGQMTPAPACLDWENPGRYILIGGHYRKKALLQNGATLIQIKLMPAKNNADLYRLSYVENDEREEGTPLDDALAWQEMKYLGEVSSDDEIAAIVKKPRTTVNKTLQILSLPPPVLDILKDTPDKFTLTAGYELTLMIPYFGPEDLQRFALQIASGDISTRELIRLKEEKKQPHSPRKPKEISRQHKILSNGAQVGTIKDWDSGKVVLEVTLLDPTERQRLVDELRIRFGSSAETAQKSLGT